MIDKVQKIRNEVERLRNELIQEREKGFGSDVDDACILELENVLTYIDSLQKESVSKDLEEAAIRYAKEEYNHKNHAILPDRCRACYAPLTYAFKAGAEWQKEQMMKDAIECKVDWYDGFLLDYTQEQQDELLEKIGADVGDKVKVIVIRED